MISVSCVNLDQEGGRAPVSESESSRVDKEGRLASCSEVGRGPVSVQCSLTRDNDSDVTVVLALSQVMPCL